MKKIEINDKILNQIRKEVLSINYKGIDIDAEIPQEVEEVIKKCYKKVW